MGEAFNDVTLKLSLQVDGQRLEPLDTSRLDKSLADAERRIKAFGAAAASEYQRQLDAIRFPTAPAGRSSASAGVVAGPNDNLHLAPLPEERERLINRRQLAPESGGSQSGTRAAIEAQSRLEEATARTTKVESAQVKIAEEIDSRNIRLAGTLGKVSNALAIGVVGYRALTQVNGEHVNILGQYESALESGAIGLSLVARGASTAVGLLGKFGIAVGAGSAAMAAIPFAVAIGGFKLLANAQAELARQQQINQALDERIAAGNEARRQRELAAERVWVDAMIGLRKRLADSAPQRLTRDLDTRNRQIGLTTDPAQRQKEFADEEQRLTRLREERQIASRRAGVDFQRAQQAGDPKAAADALERQKRINEEIAGIEQRKTAAIEGQRAAAKEIADAKRQELVEGQREAQRQEREVEQFSGLSRAEQARRSAGGKAPEAPAKPSAEIGSEIEKLDSAFKKRDEAFVASLKQQAEFENTFADKLDDSIAKSESINDSLRTFLTKSDEINQKLADAIEKFNKRMDDLDGRLGRGGSRYR